MRKIGLMVCITIAIALAACGKAEDNNPVTGTPVPTIAMENSDAEVTVEPTEAPAPEVTEAPAVEPTQVPADVWVMDEAPAIRNSLSEEEKLTRQYEILNKGTVLFSGKTNEGYYPSDISWLTGAGANDKLALIFACDDETHGGWGVLGLAVKSANGGNKQNDIAAYSDQPKKERLMVFSMEELLTQAKAEKPSDITTFNLGAWNGGRIAGLYYLPETVAAELTAFLEEVEKT